LGSAWHDRLHEEHSPGAHSVVQQTRSEQSHRPLLTQDSGRRGLGPDRPALEGQLANELGFTIERRRGHQTAFTPLSAVVGGEPVSFMRTRVQSDSVYTYHVIAYNSAARPTLE